MHEAYIEEEEFWYRKAKINWLQEGDINTKYFHIVTIERRKKNRIEAITDEYGSEYQGEEKMAEVIAKYFESLFITSQPQDCQEILKGTPRPKTEAMNGNLTRAAEDQEIKKALFSMHPHKPPELDGISYPLFCFKSTGRW